MLSKKTPLLQRKLTPKKFELIPRIRPFLTPLLLLLILIIGVSDSFAQGSVPSLKLDINGGDNPGDFGIAIQLVFFMTLLTLAPTLIMLMTSFTRIVIVLGFVKSAIGVQSAPSNQIIIGLSLFLTFFLMGPVWDKIYDEGVSPYIEKQITSKELLNISSDHIRTFMFKQTREKDIEFFLKLSGGALNDEIPMRVVIPAFILSELRTAFQMGFLIFMPFLIIDFLVSSTLMAMGMMMMPPAVISMPFKILLFVLVDGWYLLVKSLVESFSL